LLEAAMGSGGDSPAPGPSGKLDERVRDHVDSAHELLERSQQVAQQAAARVEQTYRRVERIYRRVERTLGEAKGTFQATAASVDRFIEIKRRELAAHQEALKVHEQAAALQEKLGHPKRAAEARAHAEHARELYRLACEELAEYKARAAGAQR
jgi:hypothetical protein